MSAPNIEGTTNTNVLSGGQFGVSIKSYTTVNAPVTTVAGIMYYDTTLGNLMISNSSGAYKAVITSA